MLFSTYSASTWIYKFRIFLCIYLASHLTRGRRREHLFLLSRFVLQLHVYMLFQIAAGAVDLVDFYLSYGTSNHSQPDRKEVGSEFLSFF